MGLNLLRLQRHALTVSNVKFKQIHILITSSNNYIICYNIDKMQFYMNLDHMYHLENLLWPNVVTSTSLE